METVFSLPGMGQLLVRAIFTRDYMVVQGVAMVFACATVLVNFLADVADGRDRSAGEALMRRARSRQLAAHASARWAWGAPISL